MKLLKYIFLVILLGGIAGFVFIATQPSTYSFKKEKDMPVSKEIIFNFIDNYKTWNLWNTTFESKKSTETFSDDLKTYTITTGNESIVYEKIKQYTTDSIYQKSIQNELITDVVWTFTPSKKGTLVTCEQKGKLTLKQKLLSFLQGGVEKNIGTTIETDLSNIEKYIANELNSFNIKISGVVNYSNTLFINQIDSTATKKHYESVKIIIPNLINFAQNNQIEYIEQPFVLLNYENIAKNNDTFLVCLPVKDEIITSDSSDIHGGEVLVFKALKVTLTGDYSHLHEAWKKGFEYISKNKLEVDQNGTYLESYKTYSLHENQPSKWITEIYIPLKAEIVPKKKPIVKVNGEPIVETIIPVEE